MTRPPYVDRYGVLNIEDKMPRGLPPEFSVEVDRKVENSAGVNGWRNGPYYICEQAQDEAIDIPAWLRGLDEFPKTAAVDTLVAEIGRDSAALFAKIERLKDMYG